MNCGKNKSWLMMLVCLAPFVFLITAPLLGLKNQYLNTLAFLACPLMMLIMMLVNDGKKCH